MKNSVIEKKVQEYVDSSIDVDYAILITGEWGSGKTFFIKKVMEDYFDKGEALYISITGVQEQKDLDEKIFEVVHPVISGRKNKKALGLVYSAFRGALKYKANIDVNEFVDPLAKFFKADGSEEIENSFARVLIVDDIERSKIGLEDLFGYLLPIIESGTKVILIGNEQAILKNEKWGKYPEIKEKLIGFTYHIEPEYEEFVDSIKTISEDEKNILAKIVESVALKNLRIIKQCIFQWKSFQNDTEELLQDKQDYEQELFEIYMLFAIASKANRISQFVYPGATNRNHAEMADIGTCQKEMDILWNRYKNGDVIIEKIDAEKDKTLCLYHPCNVTMWPMIIFNHSQLNCDRLQSELSNGYDDFKDQRSTIEANNSTLEEVRKIIYGKKGDIKCLFEKLCEEVEDGKYCRLDRINLFINIYETLLSWEILPVEYNYPRLYSYLGKILNDYADKITALPQIRNVSEEIYFNYTHINDTEAQKMSLALFRLAKMEVERGVKNTLMNEEALSEYFSDVNNALNDGLENPFFSRFDYKEILKIADENIDLQLKLFDFLSARYQMKYGENGHLRNTDYPDLDTIKEIHKIYQEKYVNSKGKWDMNTKSYNDLQSKYALLVDYFESEMAKNI